MIVNGSEIRAEGRFIRFARLAGEGYAFIDKPEPIIEELERINARIDIFTFTQRLSDTTPRHKFWMEWDNMAVLPISTFDRWWTEQIDFKVRNKAKQAGKKGVTVKEVPFDDTLVQGISNIYNETPIRQGKRFWHYMKDLEYARKVNQTFQDRSVFIGAYLQGELIGFAKITTDETGEQAGLMQILSMIRHRDKAPTNALIAQAVRSCADRKIQFLFYAQFSYGNKEWDGLAEFKHSNGFRRVEVPRYYVPLTTPGKLALRLGLHRGLESYISEGLLEKYRRLRSTWYAFKYRSPRKSSASNN